MVIVDGSDYLEEIKELIIEYTQMLDRDLSFQGLAHELNDLSKKYLPPQGRILAALNNEGEVVGCVAYHNFSEQVCEMKRLYVKPAFRKCQYGQKLVEAIIETASNDGYEAMVLDTIKPLKAAISLYHKVGFNEIEAYYHNPMIDVIYMKLSLK